MKVLRATSWAEALELKAAYRESVPLAGGTDVLVDLNFGRLRPDTLLDLNRVERLRHWFREEHALRIGAGVTYARVLSELASLAPGLALAARTVGSPQIRNRGTIGGNLGSGSPAGDAHPPLLASRAQVELASVRGVRLVEVDEFFLAPKRTVLAPDELISAVLLPLAGSSQQFAKVGRRNAMVIAACSFAVTIDWENRRVGTGIGSAAPTPLRAIDAESFLEDQLSECDAWAPGAPVASDVALRFGELVAAAAQPIDDVRGTAAYRRHALRVLARRTLSWINDEAAIA